MGLQILHAAILLSCMASAAAGGGPLAESTGCERKCGNITVPLPFGLAKPECSKDNNFSLTCDISTTPPTLLLGNLALLDISVENATAVAKIDIAHKCYDKSGISGNFSTNTTLESTPFMFSILNNFTAVGCDTIALMGDRWVTRFASGCISMCDSNNTNQIEDPINFTQELISCSGIGCCKTSVPKKLKTLYIELFSPNNHSTQLESNPCDFGFLSDPAWYQNANFNLKDGPAKHVYSHVILDWAIEGNTRCEDANENICGPKTNCNNSTNVDGYLCSCEEGFQGNPYTRTGCEDIDECKDPQKNLCNRSCRNTPGNYTCPCPFGKHGDGKVGCSLTIAAKVIIGIGASILLVTSGCFLFFLHKKKLQEMNHRKNGGSLLNQLSVKSFKETQLEKATNNFDAQRLLGEGGNGWVYRGSLANMVEIAVKKSKVVDQNQIEQFLNEADIVSQINHKNVVKLLGVCLESKVPMLVYEFVPNGTLHHHIHGSKSRILDTWRICLRIAAETARALDYMHSLANPPIIHRDVKPSNILLDGTYTAKVADFGASKLIPMDRTIAPTEGQGTMGYLDPEYLQTGELTTMSDVYGFGVVLMELLSKQKPLSRGLSGEMISLVKVFTSAFENNQLDKVLKVAEVTEHETEQVRLVAKLAVKCVAMPSKNRPTMTEVADVLNGFSKEYRSFPVEESGNEVVSFLDDQEVMSTSVQFEIE